jgi:hypothetical protein
MLKLKKSFVRTIYYSQKSIRELDVRNAVGTKYIGDEKKRGGRI